MTHQEIIEQMQALAPRAKELFRERTAWIDAERERIRGECGVIGHIFGERRDLLAPGMFFSCVVCGQPQGTLGQVMMAGKELAGGSANCEQPNGWSQAPIEPAPVSNLTEHLK